MTRSLYLAGDSVFEPLSITILLTAGAEAILSFYLMLSKGGSDTFKDR